MINPIKQLPQIIKTPRLEMRQLDVTHENAEIIFNAIKDENPSDFYFNSIGVDNVVPKSTFSQFNKIIWISFGWYCAPKWCVFRWKIIR